MKSGQSGRKLTQSASKGQLETVESLNKLNKNHHAQS